MTTMGTNKWSPLTLIICKIRALLGDVISGLIICIIYPEYRTLYVKRKDLVFGKPKHLTITNSNCQNTK